MDKEFQAIDRSRNLRTESRVLVGKRRLIRALGLGSLCLWLISGGWLAVRAERAVQSDNPTRVEEHLAAAQQAQKNQDYDTATREYRAVLAIRRDFAEVHMNLGLVYQLQDHIPEAMAEFRRALQLKPTLTGANFFLGVDYCKTGEAAKAIPYLRAAALQDPKRPDIWSWLATAQEMSGDLREEERTLQEGLKFEPNNVDLLYLLGHAYERLGREEANQLQKLASGSARVEQLLAESYAVSSAWSMAVIRYQNAIAIAPKTPGLHVEMGEALLRAGRVRSAAAEFDEELRIDPVNVRAITRRGEAKLLLSDIDGALFDWTYAIEIDGVQAERILGIRDSGLGYSGLEQLPDSLRNKIVKLEPKLREQRSRVSDFALAFLAVQAGGLATTAGDKKPESSGNSQVHCSVEGVSQSIGKGQMETARLCAGQVLDPRSSAEFRLLLAQALFETANYETALAALLPSSSADRLSPETHYWRGRCYEKLATSAYLRLSLMDPCSYRVHQLLGDLAAANGDDKKAMDEYRAAISAKPSLPNLHYSLGHLLWKNLQVKEARDEFEAELKLDPQHAGALNELGDTFLLDHQPSTALPYLKRALARDPGNPDMHRDLGTAYSQLGDHEKAVAEFQIALAGDHDGSVHYKLARTYQAMGLKDKAAHEFEVSATLNRESHENLEKRAARISQIEQLATEP